MKKLPKILFAIIGACVLIIITALAYLNFVYFPQKVKSEGAAYLEEKTKGQVKAESIRYIPFKGVELKALSVVSKTKKPLLTIDKLYLNINLWSLLIRRELDFRLELYPLKTVKPLSFKGLYRIKEQKLDLNFEIRSDLFLQSQPIYGSLSSLVDKEEKIEIDCNLSSRDLNVQGNFYIKGDDLRIEKFSAKILQSAFDFIGDAQDLSQPSLNIYGNLDISLEDLKKLNPKYTKMSGKLDLGGRLLGKIYITSKLNNPEIGLKMNAAQIKIGRIKAEGLSVVSKIENKKFLLSKLYAKLYGGEINIEGDCALGSEDLPANLNLNIFNLGLNELLRETTGKDSPVHGRLFGLGKLRSSLKKPKDVEGKLWLSASGSNILQLPLFSGIADILRLPELRKIKFQEASGNFAIARQEIRNSDFKIASNYIVIYIKGCMDFAGNLGCDIEPYFSRDFLQSSPNISNILGMLVGATGNFLGEIKLKGHIKKPRYTFKPVSVDKLFPRGIEEGLKQLFKFKRK